MESEIVIYIDPLEQNISPFSEAFISDKNEMLAFNAMGRANTILYLLWNKLSIWIPYFTLPISFFLILDLIYKKGEELNEVLYKTSRLLILYSILLSIGILI